MFKKKLLYLIPTAIFFFAAGVSLLLANSGHFKLLADALNLKADTNPATCSWVVSDAANNSYNGTYRYLGLDRCGHPFYTNGVRYLGMINDGRWWALSDRDDQPSNCWANFNTYRTYFTSGSRFPAVLPNNDSYWVNVPSPHFPYVNDRRGAPTVRLGPDCEDSVTPSPTDTFTVTGFVKETGTDIPLSDAKVTIAGRSAYSDPNGYFSVSDIPYSNASASSYSLAALMDNHSTILTTLNTYYSAVINSKGIHGANTIYLTKSPATAPKTFTLRGQILDEVNSKPLAGATVNLYKPDSKSPDWSGISSENLSEFDTGTGKVKYNYEVKSIDTVLPGTTLSNLKMEFVKDNYVLGSYYLGGRWETYDSTKNIPRIDRSDPGAMQTFIFSVTEAGNPQDYAIQDVRMYRKVVPVEATISGKITDNKGFALSNVEVAAKVNGFDKPWNITKDDILHSDYNEMTNNGNYKITISPAEISAKGQYLEVCAMMRQYNLNKWNCYKPTPPSAYKNGFKIMPGDNLSNINIVLDLDYEAIDWTKFELFGEMQTPDHHIATEGVIRVTPGGQTETRTDLDGSDSALPQPDRLDVNYEINDLPNISSPDIPEKSLKVTFDIQGRDAYLTDDYYLDLNNNYVNDEQQFIELKPSDLIKNLYVKNNKLYYRLDLPIKQLWAVKDTFEIRGSVVDVGDNQPIANVPISIMYMPNGFGRDTKTAADYYIDDKPEPYNFYINYVYKFDKADYALKIDTDYLKLKGYYLVDPSQATLSFTAKDLKYDSIIKSSYFDVSYKVSIETSDRHFQPKFKFMDGVTGQPINLKKEKNIRTNIICQKDDGTILSNCVKNISLDHGDKDFATTIYDLGPLNQKLDILSSEFGKSNILKFESQNYILPAEKLSTHILDYAADAEVPVSITLFNKKSNSVYCEVFSGVKFCSFLSSKDYYFRNTYFATQFKNFGQIIQSIVLQTKIDTPTIFITDFPLSDERMGMGSYDEYTIFFGSSSLGYFNPKKLISINDLSGLSTDYIVEKMGDLLLENIGSKHPSAFGATGGILGDNPFVNTLNASRKNQCPEKYAGKYYPAFSRDDNGFWNGFFSLWYLNQNLFQAALNDINIKNDKECFNVLQYEYSLLQQYYPNLKPQQPIRSTSSINALNENSQDLIANHIFETRKVFAQISDEEFEKTMLDLGYVPAETIKINSVAPLTQMNLSANQIASGIWLKSTYNKAPLRQKASFQLNMLKNKTVVLFTQNKSIVYIANQIEKINNSIESLLGKIGFKFSSAKITCSVLDEKGLPAVGYKVTVASKSAVVDSNGVFSIRRLPTGKYKVTVLNPKNNKTVFSKFISVNPDSAYKCTINLEKGRIYFSR